MAVPTTGVDSPTPPPADSGPSTRRERVGWYFYDWANSAFSTTVISVFLGPYLISIAEKAAACPPRPTDDSDYQCLNPVTHLFGLNVLPGSVFPYAVSLSVILQVVVLPVTGAIADRSSHKKQLLALFAYIGSGATVALLFLTGTRWLLGAGLFVLANIAFGASVVVYNSFLPQLADPNDRDAVSSRGWAIGYIGGGLLLLFNLVAIIIGGPDANKAEIARWSIVSAGVWWAAFTTLPLITLRNRPAVAGEETGNVITGGFKQLGRTLRHLMTYKLTFYFLIAYLIYNDGIQTVITLAGTYASQELGLSQGVQIQTILLVQFLAFGGALLLGRIARTYGAWKTVLGSLVMWTVVVGLAYFVPAHQPLAFMALGLLLGIVLGGSQALSRSLFSQLIPHGKEAEYFGLYEISDKGTSWLGPFLFGFIYSLTGSYRYAIFSLVLFFVVGFIALRLIPIRRAIVLAGNEPPVVL
jgi:MFS transporter, UMF1 family